MKVKPRVITGCVELNEVEKECVKEYITRYHRVTKWDPLEPYLVNVDNTESFEIVTVRSKNEYVDGICIPGTEHHESRMTLEEIRKRYLNKGYVNGKKYHMT